jgi:hypothetical protein
MRIMGHPDVKNELKSNLSLLYSLESLCILIHRLDNILQGNNMTTSSIPKKVLHSTNLARVLNIAF